MRAAKKSALLDAGIALLCGAAVVVAVLLAWPFAESPFNDDWSYSFTVKKLLETGHLTYNGWATAPLIAQAYWGLIWVKLFGFSYTVLRISTIPLAAAAISICYLLARRVGLTPAYAVFASLLLGFSPLFLPMAGTFMTDVPVLFLILLSIYGFVRAMESPGMVPAVMWLIVGWVVGLIGGTERQIVWVLPLVFTPYLAWLRRGDLPVVICCIVGWVFTIAIAVVIAIWFAHQPYSVSDPSIGSDLNVAIHAKSHFAISVFTVILTLLWLILPALWGLVRNWTPARALIALILFLSIVVTLRTRPGYAIAPWMANTLTSNGVMGGNELPGIRPVAMPKLLGVAIAVIIDAVACTLMADLLIWMARPNRGFRQMRKFFLYPPQNRALLPAIILFALGYFAMLLPRCGINQVYDREILPLLPCAVFPILLRQQRQNDAKIPIAATGLLAIYTLYAIAITQDVTALARARTKAFDKLLASGASPTQIEAGFECDCLTQLIVRGYVNNARISNPPLAYNKNLASTYVVQPIYRLEFSPAADSTTTPLGSVPYVSYLYPFHRSVFIDQYTDPWWLNPRKAATRPVDARHGFLAPNGLPDNSN